MKNTEDKKLDDSRRRAVKFNGLKRTGKIMHAQMRVL